MQFWAAKFLRGTDVVICADNFFCHAHKGVLFPQPEDDSRQASYLPSHPSFELVDLSDDELVARGMKVEEVAPEPEVVSRDDSDNSMTEDDLSSLELEDLKDLAKALGINPGNSCRERLIERILEAQNGE